MAWSSPVSFTPGPVTAITTAVYLALLVPLLAIHFSVPSPPRQYPGGLDVAEAWQDLLHLTQQYHPFNSRNNDQVHDWLLERINATLSSVAHSVRSQDYIGEKSIPEVFVFDDETSNLSFAGRGVGGASPVTGTYFESTNIIVYIRGTEDDPTNWWEADGGAPAGKGGVLVNAHYDSVSTGYGATDDGVGVVTLLQLLKYFTTPGNHPRKGLVLLFNNGEEDFLNGAEVFSQHPLSRFPRTFVNLEGAGAGGRAYLFRSTDAQITRFYKNAPHPAGSVVGNDGFKTGLIRSETDYSAFVPVLGLRGLDIAFMHPRARYHTSQDDCKHTSPGSVWHMLSAAVRTTEALTEYEGNEFDQETAPGSGEGQEHSVTAGHGSTGVWFDLFGSSFAVMNLRSLFVVSVTLLVFAPLLLAAIAIALSKSDRMYMFANTKALDPTGEHVPLGGMRGLFRTPVILVLAAAGPIGLAYLVEKINPYIAHRSPYLVWTMMISLWLFVSWFCSRIADFWRPSALHRAYGFTWLSVVSWVLLVVSTVKANQSDIASGYFVLFYFAGSFVATCVSYLELFALPRKLEYATKQLADDGRIPHYPALRPRSASGQLLVPSPGELASENGDQSAGEADDEDEINESTSLLSHPRSRMTFTRNYTRTAMDRAPNSRGSITSAPRSSGVASSRPTRKATAVFGNEQAWSAGLPRWSWLLQLLTFAPIAVVLVGQIGLMVTAALSQTGQDGAPTFPLYILMAGCTILVFAPILPFMHRISYHLPSVMLATFVVTLVLNLTLFPFDDGHKLKVYWSQDVALDTGRNMVNFTSVYPYVRQAAVALPSAMGQDIPCVDAGRGRTTCGWEGPMPDVLGDGSGSAGNTSDWLSYTLTRPSPDSAKLRITGRNTRGCKVVFNTPVRDWVVAGSACDARQPHAPRKGEAAGVSEVRLWSREWEHTWELDVTWESESQGRRPARAAAADAGSPVRDDGRGGRVICEWADVNQAGAIPAFEEARRYLPVWATATKYRDGLVEGYKVF
ncbi:hypothetical protein KEM52_006483 [Ascosphaera acerosa]|nr:hypothetical protein KEM52_006483 [Ascosphaera acerosa]